MKLLFKSLALFFSLLLTLSLCAQNNYPKDDFIPPVDFDMALSGTFGELRSNHFHSGIDIKTQGVQGKKLRAVADGFISRIAVSPGGFGKAIYIEHPNGYTSVYGHCKSFTKEIDAYVKDEQYKLESFKVNLFPDNNRFTVKQGDVIAYSGNTGGSMGPHLHFEIRETIDQVPVNPLLLEFPVKDFIRPKIGRLMIYPYGNFSLIDGQNKPLEQKLAGWGPDYRLKNNDTIQVSGNIYLGIETHDVLNAAKNKNGVYSIQVFIDSVEVYAHKLEKFSFTESKYINSLIDYNYYSENKKRIQKTYVEPANQLSIYSEVFNNGIFEFIDNDIHMITYVVKDIYENESVLKFSIKSNPPIFHEVFANGNHQNDGIVFAYDQENIFEDEDIKLIIPKGALYDTLQFQYSVQESESFVYSKIYNIHNKSKPLHKSGKLMIVPQNIDTAYRDKYLISLLDDKGDKLYGAGGKWEGDFIISWISKFGSYVVSIDTVPPEINPVNIFPGKDLKGQYSIKVKIKDELSGIKTYRATMNEKWILMDWDPKTRSLTYSIDKHTAAGKNQFRLAVTDGRSNESVYEAELIR